ncbi:hypothetical protein ACHAXT_000775 [Thalassiosira profunda]
MFASNTPGPAPGGAIDELEVDRVPSMTGGDVYETDADDATELSRGSYLPFLRGQPLAPAGGSIRMEGWLNHTTSSHKDQAAGEAAPSAVSSSSASILSKKVSKKKRSRKKSPRYFVLRGSTLSYYARRHDVKAKGTFVLTRGCTVGPVVFGSLDEPISSASIVTADQLDEHPSSPTRDGAPSALAATEHATNKSKKKKRRMYMVQVSWPVDNKPSKDEKVMAQAKAQVAAESEKEALQQTQQLGLNESFEEASVASIVSRSPKILRSASKQLPRRSKSESASASVKSPRKNLQQAFSTRTMEDLAPPDLREEPEGNDNAATTNGKGLPLPPPRPLNTPASALAGSNAFHHPKVGAESETKEAGASGSGALNHETGLHKHYTQQLEKHAKDQQKSEEELQKVMKLLSKKESHKKTKKRVIQGGKIAAVSTAAITAGVLTAGIGLAAGLVFVGIAAGAGGSGAYMGSKMLGKAKGKYLNYQSKQSFHLIIGATTFEEALKWKLALERIIEELVLESDEDEDGAEWRTLQRVLSGGEAEGGEVAAPSSPKSPRRTPNGVGAENVYLDLSPKWVPIQGGGVALWGMGGGGGNLRIFREETPQLSSPWPFSAPASSAFPKMPRFRSDVGLVGQPFPPFKASMTLKANSLDAFMCLMCSGRIQGDEGLNVGDGAQPLRLPVPNSGQIASFRIIETLDDHMDVVHLVFRPQYLFPSWTAPRDFVLFRFWKYDDDGTYQICFDSGMHRDCPPVPGYVRGEMHSVYTIAPLKRKKKRAGSAGTSTAGGSRPNLMNEECLVSHVVQIDPRGWVPTTSSVPFFRNQGYGDAFAIMALHQMLDVKEALDSMRFVAVPTDSQGTAMQQSLRKKASRVGTVPRSGRGLARDTSGGSVRSQQLYMPSLDNRGSGELSDDEELSDYDYQYSSRELLFSADGYRQSSSSSAVRNDSLNESSHMDGARASSISTVPPPTLSQWWAEPDANSFRVRGKTYKTDNKKINAGSSLFRLFATDIVETDVPIMTGMCSHPKERVQQALQRDREAKANGIDSSECPPFVFAINIVMPGPPNYHMVFYYAVDDLSMIDGSDGTPSSKLCQEFFWGKDDTFRDNTFKLIPQIIEGNFMVRKAVGCTPAIMGNKIKQTYFQGERFFELMIDTGSSSVAAGVIRICNGYAKMIVVDLAFLFEGYNESTLPERVLGCVRLKNVEFGKKLRFVECVDE